MTWDNESLSKQPLGGVGVGTRKSMKYTMSSKILLLLGGVKLSVSNTAESVNETLQ